MNKNPGQRPTTSDLGQNEGSVRSNANHPVKIATMKKYGDSKPKVLTTTIQAIWSSFIQKPSAPAGGSYDDYWALKALLDETKPKVKLLRTMGKKDEAIELAAEVKVIADRLQAAKDAHAFLPFIHSDDITYATDGSWADGSPKYKRDTTRITHFGALILDIDSGATAQDIDRTFQRYEFMRYPSISYREDKERWRVILFLKEPVTTAIGQKLIYQADSLLPVMRPDSKLLCLDSSNTDVGRLMYAPRWLKGHPVAYDSLSHWNHGELLDAETAFNLSPSEAAKVDARLAAFEANKVKAKEASSKQHAHNPLATDAIIHRNGKVYLNPEGELELSNGLSVTVKDINGKISGVACPNHGDIHGSEFVDVGRSGTPYLRCKTCDTIWMWQEPTEAAPVLNLKRKVSTPVEPNEVITLQQLNLHASETDDRVTYFEDDVVKHFDQRFLPRELANIFSQRSVIAVRSPKGTGKTQLNNHYIRSLPPSTRVLLVGHRINLLRSLADQLGIAFYQDIDPEEYAAQNQLAITLNSLPKIQGFMKPYDVVIIDESEQVLQTLESEHLKRDIPVIYKAFDWLVRTAKQITLLDADLSTELTLELITLIRGFKDSDTYLGLDNVYQIGKGHTTLMYEKKNHLFAQMVTDIVEDGVRGFMACNSKRLATQTHAMFTHFGIKSLLITAETSTRPDVQSFIDNPRGEAVNYQVVCASPSVSTGLSIDADEHKKPAFERVYGFFNQGDIATFQDVDQAVARVRECNDVHVWVQGNTEPYVGLSRKHIEAELLKKLHTMTMATYDEVIEVTEGQRKWAKIIAIIRREVQRWKHNKDEQFIALRKKLGYEISMVLADKEASKIGAELLESFKDAGSIRGEEIFNARELDANEFTELIEQQNRVSLEYEDFLAVTRYKFKEIAQAGGLDFTLELCVQLDKEGFMGRMRNWRLRSHTSMVDLKSNDRREHTHNKDQFTAWSANTIKKALTDRLVAAAKVDLEDLRVRAVAGEEVEITETQLTSMVDAFVAQEQDYNRIFDVRIKNPAANAKRIWDAVIGSPMGLPLIKKKRGPRGQQVARYYVDPEEFKTTLSLATKHNTSALYEMTQV